MVPVRERAWRLEHVDDSPETRRNVASCCDAAAVDHAYVEANLKFSDMKLLAIDMDSTLITIECIDELADFAGKKEQVAAITEATMRGEIADFAESLRRRVALLEGLDEDALRRVYEERLRLSPGAQTLIDAAHANDMYLLLVSGGFTYFADRLKKSLSFDAAYSNQLEVTNGELTGRLVGEIVDASVKAARVKESIDSVGCDSARAMVVGDGANDIPMMQSVPISIAYRAKSKVKEVATIAISYGGLDAIVDFLY